MIELHPNCRKRLVETIAAGITSIVVQNGSISPYSAYDLAKADEVLPSKLRDKLTTYVDETPVLTFVTGRLDRELQQFLRRPKLSSGKLTAIDGYHDPTEVAERLVTEFSSLPWQYSLTVRLPDDLSSALFSTHVRTELNDNIRLIRPDENFRQRFPFQIDQAKLGGVGLLSDLAPLTETWIESGGYLQIDTPGFIGPYGHSVPVWNAERTLRAFCGLGIGLGLFAVRPSLPPAHVQGYFVLHQQQADKCWQFERKLNLSEELKRALSILRIPLRLRAKNEEKFKWVGAKLSALCRVFSAKSNSEPLLLASQWLFDSYTGHDELLNYVQAMVVLEILLGEEATSDEIGLGQLLRNRCAYLISRSYEDRGQVLADFEQIYHVRSQIVHRGKSRLTKRERELFSKLHSMCRRVIQKEVDFLGEDQRREQL